MVIHILIFGNDKVGAGYDDKERVALTELDYEITNT